MRGENTPRCGLDRSGKCGNIRVLIDKLGAVVDDIVDNDVKVLLGVVLGNVLVGEFLSGHLEIGGTVSRGNFSVSGEPWLAQAGECC